MSEILDITHVVRPAGGDQAAAVFPGDTPPTREVLLDMARGDNITLSTLRSTVHLGTHADAESHYARDGRTIEAMPLDRYIGPCIVLDGEAARRRGAQRVADADLPALARLRDASGTVMPPRVLVRTGSWPDPCVFNTDFLGIEPGLIESLASLGAFTIGVDTPSVDPASSKDLPAHAACARRGVTILEGLDLSAVAPGVYELVALPLKLAGFDASPVRAVLRRR